MQCIDAFLGQLRERGTVDMNDWALFLTFDSMGLSVFNQTYGMLKTGEWHPEVYKQKKNMSFLELGLTVPWLVRMKADIPKRTTSVSRVLSWYYEQMDKKIAVRSVKNAVSMWLMEGCRSLQLERNRRILRQCFWRTRIMDTERCILMRITMIAASLSSPGDLYLYVPGIVMAGADISTETTASSFVGALVHLSQNPRVLRKLREALDEAFPGGDVDYVYPSQTTMFHISKT